MRPRTWIALGAGAAGVAGLVGSASVEAGRDGHAGDHPSAAAGPTLHVVERGVQGPTLVLLPGVGGTTRYWDSRVVPLASDYRLLLVDPLGFGHSPKPATTYSVERHVAELHRVLKGRGRVTLVGHSFGALLSIAYAARFPESVDGLVLIGLPYFGSEARALAHFRSGRAPDRWVMTNAALAGAACVVTRRVLGRALPWLMPNLPREVAEDLVQHTWRSSTSTMWEVVYRYDAAPDAMRLPVELPVLLLHGEHDPTAPLAGVHRLMREHPGWELAVLPEGDHHPLLRDPAWVMGKLRPFLGARPPTEAMPPMP